MENTRVENLVAMEKAAPKRRILRSDGALYVVLLIAVVGVIVAGHAISARWDLPRLYVQLTLYALLLAIGYLVYRHCLIVFRYTLTDRMFTVDRIVGRKQSNDVSVHLCDISSIRPWTAAQGTGETGKLRSLYNGRRADTLCVAVPIGGKRNRILISASEEFAGKLMAQWKTARK